MKANSTKRFFGDESGAVAATYALALIPLVAFAGVAFDYARVMGLDSELQNGADQAALAAASQLDGRPGACERAVAAATGMLDNLAVLSSESQYVTVSETNDSCDQDGFVRFYSDKAKTAASDYTDARFVEVVVDARRMNYSLLPIVGTYGATLSGVAFAGLGSAICKIPPVMMCNPTELTTGGDFDTYAHVGKGLRLIANDAGGYVPGVFGYLETDAGSGASATSKVLGLLSPPGNCIDVDTADVKPGVQVSVLDALNTRMGVYSGGLNICGTDNVNCPGSANSRIDLVKKTTATNGNACAIGPQGFQVGDAPFRPPSGGYPTGFDYSALDPMGFPRDTCHAHSNTGNCSGGRLGDGAWDRTGYYATNPIFDGLTKPTPGGDYGYDELKQRTEDGATQPTRYQQYRWEYEQRENGALARQDASGGNYSQGGPMCGPAGVPPASSPDRRVLSIAIINCDEHEVSASTDDAPILKFIDVFLIEPSAARSKPGSPPVKLSEASDVYVEIIGETVLGGGANEGQKIRKDVPYLIE